MGKASRLATMGLTSLLGIMSLVNCTPKTYMAGEIIDINYITPVYTRAIVKPIKKGTDFDLSKFRYTFEDSMEVIDLNTGLFRGPGIRLERGDKVTFSTHRLKKETKKDTLERKYWGLIKKEIIDPKGKHYFDRSPTHALLTRYIPKK